MNIHVMLMESSLKLLCHITDDKGMTTIFIICVLFLLYVPSPRECRMPKLHIDTDNTDMSRYCSTGSTDAKICFLDESSGA